MQTYTKYLTTTSPWNTHVVSYRSQSWHRKAGQKSNGYHSNMWFPIYPFKFKTLGWGPPEVSPLGTELWLPAQPCWLKVLPNLTTPKTQPHTVFLVSVASPLKAWLLLVILLLWQLVDHWTSPEVNVGHCPIQGYAQTRSAGP